MTLFYSSTSQSKSAAQYDHHWDSSGKAACNWVIVINMITIFMSTIMIMIIILIIIISITMIIEIILEQEQEDGWQLSRVFLQQRICLHSFSQPSGNPHHRHHCRPKKRRFVLGIARKGGWGRTNGRFVGLFHLVIVPKIGQFWLRSHNMCMFVGIFLATLVALHFTSVSESVGEWVVVSDWRSLELASLLSCNTLP